MMSWVVGCAMFFDLTSWVLDSSEFFCLGLGGLHLYQMCGSDGSSDSYELWWCFVAKFLNLFKYMKWICVRSEIHIIFFDVGSD